MRYGSWETASGNDLKNKQTPLLTQEGWTRARGKSREATLLRADGVANFGTYVVLDHPVCGAKVGCAIFFLMPQPPLLCQEGNLLPPTVGL